MAFSPDCRTVATLSSMGTLALWTVSSGAGLYSVQTACSHSRAMTFNRSGSEVIIGDGGGVIRCHNATSGALVSTMTSPRSPFEVATLTLARDSDLVATSDMLGHISVWNANTRALVLSARKSDVVVLSLVLTPDRSSLVYTDIRLGTIVVVEAGLRVGEVEIPATTPN